MLKEVTGDRFVSLRQNSERFFETAPGMSW
jgi:hypothetical protein